MMFDNDAAYAALETTVTTRNKVMLQVSFPSGKKYSGLASIVDFPIDAPYDDSATYSVSFLGSGELAKTTA
jgi:predicted secreted protein